MQAVEAARAIQQANAEGELPLRIGIHVGDVVVQGDDLMGDGVNIAARIEGVAEPGGIAISREVHDQVRDKLDLGFEDKGEIELKNMARPVHVFSIAGSKPTAATAPALALPDKPSIAVLPFQNMSGDPEQEYFADGVVEDIITALSRFQSLFVIARNSSLLLQGQVARHPAGRQGTRRPIRAGGQHSQVGNRIRVTGQLIDTLTGNHIWAERYDRVLEDIFAVQEEVTRAIVARDRTTDRVIGAIEGHSTRARAVSAPTKSPFAHRAHALEACDKADRTLLDQSIRRGRNSAGDRPEQRASTACTCAVLMAMHLYLQMAVRSGTRPSGSHVGGRACD